MLDCHVPALDMTSFGETPSETGETNVIGFRRPLAQITDHRDDRLLRTNHLRIGEGHAGKQRDKLAPLHSITSSARAESVGGISNPSVFAVFRLITNWKLVGCATGRSPGFSPLRMRPA